MDYLAGKPTLAIWEEVGHEEEEQRKLWGLGE